jgi:hypothetical protein
MPVGSKTRRFLFVQFAVLHGHPVDLGGSLGRDQAVADVADDPLRVAQVR